MTKGNDQSLYIMVAFREGEPDRHCVLKEGICVIGRGSESDLVLPDSTVSRKHAAIILRNGRAVLEDQDSVNGVFVNGEQVRSATIREGDFLTVGAYTLVLRAFRESDRSDSPKGKTLCIGFDAARRLHEKSFERHIPKNVMALYRAVLLFGEPLHFNEVLRQVLTLVLESLSARRSIVILRRDGSMEQEIAASVSRDGAPLLGSLDSRIVNYVTTAKIAFMAEDARTDPRFQFSDGTTNSEVGAAMCVPLCGGGQPVGVLYLDAHPETPPFTESDLQFVSTVGHIIGVIVENRLLNQTITRHERLAAMGRAVAGIAHDVRNLLTGAKAGVDLLESVDGSKDPKRLLKASAIVRKSVHHVETYLNDLLLFARESEIERRPTAIHSLAQDAIGALLALAEEHKVQLAYQGGGFERASIDGLQIHRVLINLLKNGIEACPGEGGLVRLSLERKAGALIIQVTDTGTGITSEDLPRLSEPFFTTKKRGTGLGLAVCYRIAEKHGGKIDVSSEPGKGSVFTLVLPDSFPPRVPAPSEQRHGAVEETAFKTCPTCGFIWRSQDDMLADPDVGIIGYQAHFEELALGLFYFNHGCGTTLGIPAGDFRHLYDGPVFPDRLQGTAECPGYCLNKSELRSCPARCECAYVLEIGRIIGSWPKR